MFRTQVRGGMLEHMKRRGKVQEDFVWFHAGVCRETYTTFQQVYSVEMKHG